MSEPQRKQMLASNVATRPAAHRLAHLVKNWRWTKQRVRAAYLVAENVQTRAAIANEVGISTRQLLAWLQVPAFSQFIERKIDETRKALAERYIAQKQQRIASYIEDFERTDQIIKERAEALKDVPGGKSGLITHDVKSIGAGENATMVDIYEFDAALVRERRAIRKDVAEELGQLTQKHDFKFSGDPRELSPEQLLALENHMVELACGGDKAKIDAFQRELEGPVVETTAEVVHDPSDVPESE